jgi:formate dehydrogenase major subunit
MQLKCNERKQMPGIQITLNGKKVTADSEETILEAARKEHVFIPTLCHDERLEPFGSCRVCLVKVKGAKSLVPSCTTKVTEGMEIHTDDPDVVEARKMSLSLLISDHFGDCVAPCSLECPAHIDIQGYIALIGAGKFSEAVKLIKEKNPMPLTIGRICPHPCERVCRRNKVDEPIAINNLKRFAADYDSMQETHWAPEIAPSNGKRIAVIGSGPAGLSCSYYLAVKGYDVTVFERNPRPGGMLRYGIPEYRLPSEILDREIGYIEELGVTIQCGEGLGRDFTIADLKNSGYHAVFLGIGAQKSINLKIEGEEHSHVIGGIEFLYAHATARPLDIKGKTVIVTGGGNTAMDAARTALRLGASTVTVLYRRTRNEMPANEAEIWEAEEEGILFEYLAAPIRIEHAGDMIDVECIHMELGPPDSSGRRRPIPIAGSNHRRKAHLLITAIGQRTDAFDIGVPELISARDNIQANLDTGITADRYIYAGGDCVTGAATAIEAIAAGRKAAISIDLYLTTGVQREIDTEEFSMTKGPLKSIPETLFEMYPKEKRVSMPALGAEKRIQGFQEIELGLSEADALREASRCLECGCIERFSCALKDHCTLYGVDQYEIKGEKNLYPEHNNVLDDHPAILRDENKCIKCGICVRICEEVWGLNVFGYHNRGFKTEIAPYFHLELRDTACDFCGQCADSCPTGALALNSILRKPGPFECEKVEGNCIHCSLVCALEYNIYDNMILKTTSAPLMGENEGNLCVRGRFGFGYLRHGERCVQPMFLFDRDKKPVELFKAVSRAADIIDASKKLCILTSTQLSNEEYRKLSELEYAVDTADLYHVSYDMAEAVDSSYPVVGKRKAFEDRLRFIASPSLSEISESEAIVLFNIFPGRNYPILEMNIRNAAKRGAQLFIINQKPTRLDEYAESIFRVRSPYSSDLLTFASSKGKMHPGSHFSEAHEFFTARQVSSSIFSDIHIKPGKITHLIEQVMKARTVSFIADEDMCTTEELEAFIMMLLSLNDRAKLLLMQRGVNPLGAQKMLREVPKKEVIGRELFEDYDSLLLYKLPDLFKHYTIPFIHFGFAPVSGSAYHSVFIPSSSLLETGGTVYKYNGKEVSIRTILNSEHGLENVATLTQLIGQIAHVR